MACCLPMRRDGFGTRDVLKWIKLAVAILLLPFCGGAIGALLRVLRAAGSADTFWVAFLGGAACWLAVFLLLPKPMLVYVFGHELTHALWTWLFGGRVKRFKFSANGGHVVITRSNFLIVLAPYFFPLYAVVVVLIFAIGHLLLGVPQPRAWFHLCLGAAYSFHLTLTWHILQTRQSDITSQGVLFSGVVIFLGNIIVMLVGLPLLTARAGLLTVASWWLQSTVNLLQQIARVFS
jgi:hypothetical protein